MEHGRERPRGWRGGETLVRLAVLAVAIAAVATGCSSDSKPQEVDDPTVSAEILKKDCADPHWREQNLGLWYSVCRQPMRW